VSGQFTNTLTIAADTPWSVLRDAMCAQFLARAGVAGAGLANMGVAALQAGQGVTCPVDVISLNYFLLSIFSVCGST
jgi:hypothetical protein